jgi:hypothetical protein
MSETDMVRKVSDPLGALRQSRRQWLAFEDVELPLPSEIPLLTQGGRILPARASVDQGIKTPPRPFGKRILITN